MSTTYISFMSSKGGGGKTTLVGLLATMLNYKTSHRILVIDADYSESLYEIRLRDMELHKEEFKEVPYPILPDGIHQERQFNRLLEKYHDKFDYIIFDTPGSDDFSRILPYIKISSFVFIPIVARRRDISGQNKFLRDLYEHRQYFNGRAYGIINKKDNTNEYSFIRDAYKDQITMLTNGLSHYIVYDRDMSTVNPLHNPEVINLFDEFYKIIST